MFIYANVKTVIRDGLVVIMSVWRVLLLPWCVCGISQRSVFKNPCF